MGASPLPRPDLKPLLGLLLPELVAGFRWWGWADVDVLFGDLGEPWHVSHTDLVSLNHERVTVPPAAACRRGAALGPFLLRDDDADDGGASGGGRDHDDDDGRGRGRGDGCDVVSGYLNYLVSGPFAVLRNELSMNMLFMQVVLPHTSGAVCSTRRRRQVVVALRVVWPSGRRRARSVASRPRSA